MTPATLTAQLQQRIEPLITRFIGPKNLGRIATRMPDRLNSLLVEKLVNTAFAEQIGDGDFDFLEDRLLQVEIIDAGLFVGLGFDRDKLLCRHFSHNSQESDVTLSINSKDAIQLIQQEIDPDTLFFQRKLKINGDTELAHYVKNTIDTLDPDVIPPLLQKLIANYKTRVLD